MHSRLACTLNITASPPSASRNYLARTPPTSRPCHLRVTHFFIPLSAFSLPQCPPQFWRPPLSTRVTAPQRLLTDRVPAISARRVLLYPLPRPYHSLRPVCFTNRNYVPASSLPCNPQVPDQLRHCITARLRPPLSCTSTLLFSIKLAKIWALSSLKHSVIRSAFYPRLAAHTTTPSDWLHLRFTPLSALPHSPPPLLLMLIVPTSSRI